MNPFVLEYLGEVVDLLWDCASLCDCLLFPDVLDVLCILASVVTRNRTTEQEMEISVVNQAPLSFVQKETADAPMKSPLRATSATHRFHSAHLSVTSVTLPLYDTYLYHVLDDFAQLADSKGIHSDSFSRVYKAVVSLPALYV